MRWSLGSCWPVRRCAFALRTAESSRLPLLGTPPATSVVAVEVRVSGPSANYVRPAAGSLPAWLPSLELLCGACDAWAGALAACGGSARLCEISGLSLCAAAVALSRSSAATLTSLSLCAGRDEFLSDLCQALHCAWKLRSLSLCLMTSVRLDPLIGLVAIAALTDLTIDCLDDERALSPIVDALSTNPHRTLTALQLHAGRGLDPDALPRAVSQLMRQHPRMLRRLEVYRNGVLTETLRRTPVRLLYTERRAERPRSEWALLPWEAGHVMRDLPPLFPTNPLLLRLPIAN
jgi:hypothetical protein